MSCVKAIPLSRARATLAEVVDSAASEPVALERRGRPAVVLLSPARYAELLAAEEESEDVAAFDAALAEGGPAIPWEQVRVDLGWA